MYCHHRAGSAQQRERMEGRTNLGGGDGHPRMGGGDRPAEVERDRLMRIQNSESGIILLRIVKSPRSATLR